MQARRIAVAHTAPARKLCTCNAQIENNAGAISIYLLVKIPCIYIIDDTYIAKRAPEGDRMDYARAWAFQDP